jgi:hypothetical protein
MPGHWGHRIQSRAKPAHPHACLLPLVQSANPGPFQRTWPVISDAFTDEEKVVCTEQYGSVWKAMPLFMSTTLKLIVLTMMVMIRSNLPEGIYHTTGLYLHALVCACVRCWKLGMQA